MKIRSFTLLTLLIPALLMSTSTPATAVEILASGRIDVSSDFSACAQIKFNTSQTVVVGEFSATGYSAISAQASAQQVGGAVLDAAPVLVLNGDSWSACLTGSGAPVVNGSAVFTLEATGPTGDILIVKKCTVVDRQMICAGV